MARAVNNKPERIERAKRYAEFCLREHVEDSGQRAKESVSSLAERSAGNPTRTTCEQLRREGRAVEYNIFGKVGFYTKGENFAKMHEKRLIDGIYEPYFSDPPGARTQDPNIKSVVLYQLS